MCRNEFLLSIFFCSYISLLIFNQFGWSYARQGLWRYWLNFELKTNNTIIDQYHSSRMLWELYIIYFKINNIQWSVCLSYFTFTQCTRNQHKKKEEKKKKQINSRNDKCQPAEQQIRIERNSLKQNKRRRRR